MKGGFVVLIVGGAILIVDILIGISWSIYTNRLFPRVLDLFLPPAFGLMVIGTFCLVAGLLLYPETDE